MAEQSDEKQQFDYINFVKDLTTQAESLVPVDINPEDKQYVTNIVYNFCNLACEAIIKEDKFSLEDVTLITQFIGEWTFHKSIDLIRAGVAPQFRDVVLQKIAFVVFEIAKQAILNKLAQPQVLQVVEHHVKKAYLESLTELKEKNSISPEDYDKAMGESNIDKMAEEQEEKNADNIPTNKLLKLATLAMVLKKMPMEKTNIIINKLAEEEARILRDYMTFDDLQEKIDPTTTIQYIKELQSNVPKALHINENKLQNKFSKIVTKKNEAKINAIILQERDGVKEYLTSIREKKESSLPPQISNVIYEYLAEKIKT